MAIVGYQLVSTKDGAILQEWGGIWGAMISKPDFIICPNGDHVHCPELNTEYGGAQLIEWNMDDPIFYDISNQPLSLSGCQTNLVSEINKYVSSALAPTDWQIIRESEGYKVANDATKAYRKSVRDQGNALVAEVKAITDFDTITKWQPHDWPVMK